MNTSASSRGWFDSGQVVVGISGFGNVGQTVASRLVAGAVPGASLVAINSRRPYEAGAAAAAISPDLRVMELDVLCETVDVVIETATAVAFPVIARAALGAQKTLIAVSAAGILDCPDLASLAGARPWSVIIASGTLPGLDFVRSAAAGTISQVTLISRQPVRSLRGEPYITERFTLLPTPGEEPVRVFAGSAREVAEAFPRHFNIAISLALAGIGLDKTRVEVWCDPDLPGAIHQIDVEGEEVSATLISRNVPSANPRTSRIVAPSVLAALRSLTEPIRIGS